MEARETHHAGRLDLARAAYDLLLSAAPEDAEVRGLLGVLALQEGRLGDAEALLRRAVGAGGEARIYLRNLNNLLVLLQQTGNSDAARKLVAGDLPDWPEGAARDASERQTVLSLCRALRLLDRAPAARALLEQAIPEPGDDAEVLGLMGQILLALGETTPAAEALERAAQLAPSDCQPMIGLSYARDQLGQPDAARAAAKRIAAIAPVYSAASQPSQRASILVLNPSPTKVKNLDGGLHALHFATNFPTQFATSMCAEFRFLSVFAEQPSASLPQNLPKVDVILNNCVDPETMNVPGRLDIVIETMERAGVPVINHPRAVFATTRQKAAVLLEGIPNLKVPRIERYRADLTPAAEVASDIEGRFAYPVIIRRCLGHNSTMRQHSEIDRVAVLVEDRKALHDYLTTLDWTEIYAVEYLPLRQRSGQFRKIRAVLTEDDVIVAIPGFASEWMVDGGRWRQDRVDYYRAHPEATAEARRIVLNPEGCLGADCLRTLEAIRDRMPLDFFGVDFDVDDAGQVVFFEANAAMNVLKRDHEPEDVTMPDAPFERIKAAFRRAVDRRIGAAG
jgi:Flp pilus assembly protein TadD/glutathione synthase/RimK-type ligase-like ATP-grasp enzyme